MHKVNIKVKITSNEKDGTGMYNTEYVILEPALIKGMKGFIIARNIPFHVGGVYSGSLQLHPGGNGVCNDSFPLIQEINEDIEYVPYFGERIYSFFDGHSRMIENVYRRYGRTGLGKSYNTDEYIEAHFK